MSIDVKIFQLAFERLITEVDELKKQNSDLRKDLDELKSQEVKLPQEIPKPEPVSSYELLDTKEVLKILGVSYNTLQTIVRRGELKPIRINQRRVRYSKIQIIEFIESKQND